MRPDGRTIDSLRPVKIECGVMKHAEGSALISFGATEVLCSASIESRVPSFLKDTGKGWVTAEYGMLPRSTNERVPRTNFQKGRSVEISRLIGRSLRAAVNLEALGERQITVDCDVLHADGGTRTAAITGGYVALHQALLTLMGEGVLAELPFHGQCAAISVGIVDGELRLDLCYEEDSAADVDVNVVMRSDGLLVEFQASAEGKAFTKADMDGMYGLAHGGIQELFRLQKEALNDG